MKHVVRFVRRLATVTCALTAVTACGGNTAFSGSAQTAAPPPPAAAIEVGQPRPAPYPPPVPSSAPPEAGASVVASVDTSANVPTLGPLLGSDKEIQALYLATKDQPAGMALAVRAAHQLAASKKVAGEKVVWMKNVVLAWEVLDTKGERTADGKTMAQNSPFADYGAEAAFTLLDDEIRQKWDASPTRKSLRIGGSSSTTKILSGAALMQRYPTGQRRPEWAA